MYKPETLKQNPIPSAADAEWLRKEMRLGVWHRLMCLSLGELCQGLGVATYDPRAPKIYRSSAPLSLEGPSHFKAFGPADHTMVLGWVFREYYKGHYGSFRGSF